MVPGGKTDGIPTSGSASAVSPVCPHDRTNMLWSADAILASCTETFRQDLKLCIPQPRYGPKLLMVIFNKRFRPSLANGKVLLDSLGILDIRKYAGENVTLFVQDATKIVREIQMTFMSSNPMPELTMTALTGLTNSTDGMLLLEVRRLRRASNVNGFGAVSKSRVEALAALQEIEELYLDLVNQKDYEPLKHAPAARALVATHLVQDRNADKTHGGGIPKTCFACGQTGHFQNNPACPKFQAATGGTPPGSDLSGGSGSRKSRHGLSDAVLAEAKALAKTQLSTLPARENIPADAEYNIKLKNPQGIDYIVGKWCTHCNRFVCGASMHYTKEHKGTTRFVAPAQVAAPVVAAVAGLVPALTAAAPVVPVVAAVAGIVHPPNHAPSSAPIDLASVPVISSEAFLNRQTQYDFGSMPTINAHLAQALEDGDEASFLAVLGNVYGG
jgi:hypothetical protein